VQRVSASYICEYGIFVKLSVMWEGGPGLGISVVAPRIGRGVDVGIGYGAGVGIGSARTGLVWNRSYSDYGIVGGIYQ
jgi:hypothetical protein